MEQQHRAGAATPAVEVPAQQGATGTVYQAGELRPAGQLSRGPRLTALGAGLGATVAMLAVAGPAALLLGGSITVYGMIFLPVGVLTALWVRPADLVAAPVVVPIAYAVGLLVVVGPHPVNLLSSLALGTGWLYGGTLAAGLLATVRKLVHRVRRRAAARR